MSDGLLIALAIIVLAIVGYFVYMRVIYRQSKELDKKIDPTKMKKWEDDE